VAVGVGWFESAPHPLLRLSDAAMGTQTAAARRHSVSLTVSASRPSSCLASSVPPGSKWRWGSGEQSSLFACRLSVCESTTLPRSARVSSCGSPCSESETDNMETSQRVSDACRRRTGRLALRRKSAPRWLARVAVCPPPCQHRCDDLVTHADRWQHAA
jgi:hypothetical protein